MKALALQLSAAAAPTQAVTATWSDAVLAAVMRVLDLPALVLVSMLLMSLWVTWQAQKRSDFDFGRMLKDDAGKESALRLGVLGSFAVSSWLLMHEALEQKQTDPWLFAIYLGTWSGSLVFLKAVEKWNGQLPWSK